MLEVALSVLDSDVDLPELCENCGCVLDDSTRSEIVNVCVYCYRDLTR